MNKIVLWLSALGVVALSSSFVATQLDLKNQKEQEAKIASEIMSQLHQSHIVGNTPPGQFFDQYLKRDLNNHFCNFYNKKVRCEYSLMQKEAIQIGVGYPYYYIWVKIYDAATGKLIEEGLTSAEAMDKTEFSIGKFIRPRQINAPGFAFPEIFRDELVDNVRNAARKAAN